MYAHDSAVSEIKSKIDNVTHYIPVITQMTAGKSDLTAALLSYSVYNMHQVTHANSS